MNIHVRKFLHPFFHETVPVTYEPAVPVAVLNTALLCTKKRYFIAKTGQFWLCINLRIEFYLFISHGVMKNRGSTCKFRKALYSLRNLHVHGPSVTVTSITLLNRLYGEWTHPCWYLFPLEYTLYFPVYGLYCYFWLDHRVWALWWQGGKRRLRMSRCPCRGRLGTLKTHSCPWRGCPAAGKNLETGHLVPSLYTCSWNIAECDVKPQSKSKSKISDLTVHPFLTWRVAETSVLWKT